MTNISIRSARSWTEVGRTAAGAGRAFDGRNAAGSFFRGRTVDAPALPLENTLVLFVDDDLAGALQIYERRLELAGVPLPAGAIGNVFTLPAYRGEGHGRRLLDAAREFLAEKGYPVSLLRTSIHEFYGGAGWQVCPSPVHVVVDPPGLDATAGEWTDFDPDVDLDTLAAVYREGTDREGRFRRPRSLWDGWTFDPRTEVLDPEQVDLYLHEGRCVGYLVSQPKNGATECLEVAYRGPSGMAGEFYAACWNELVADEPAEINWRPSLPEDLHAGLEAAGVEIERTANERCMVGVHDERPLARLVDVTTTAGLVDRLRGSDWYWSEVDAF